MGERSGLAGIGDSARRWGRTVLTTAAAALQKLLLLSSLFPEVKELSRDVEMTELGGDVAKGGVGVCACGGSVG